MPDQVYKNLCDYLLLEHKEELKKEHVYEIKYVMPYIFYDKCNNKIFNKPNFKSKLIKLTYEEYIKISSDIRKEGCSSTYLTGKIIMERKVKYVANPETEDYIEVYNEPYIYFCELVK